MIKMLDLSNKSDRELVALKNRIKISDADIDTKIANIEAIDAKLLGRDYKAILEDIKAGMADMNDIHD
jgi:hypothetical protein